MSDSIASDSMTRVVAGNWKMHHGPSATRSFFRELLAGLEDRDPGEGPRIAVFPPALSFHAAREALVSGHEGSSAGMSPASVQLGVQNIHWESSGAYTGELSAAMAREAGAGMVLVGHSERRHVFGETDEEVARKTVAARGAGLIPVICVGETLEERKADRVDEVILRQLGAALDAIGGEDAGDSVASGTDALDPGRFMVAYEPVWAIGTGETATPEDASAAHATLRRLLGERPSVSAGPVPILYGGSVKPHNAEELMEAPDVDGVLVGGASLEAGSFLEIIAAA